MVLASLRQQGTERPRRQIEWGNTVHVSTSERSQGVTEIALSGDLDALGVKTVREELEQLVAANDDDLVLELGEVSFIDSAGVALIVFLFKRMVAANRSLRLVGVAGQPLDTMTMLRLERVVPINRRDDDLPGENRDAP